MRNLVVGTWFEIGEGCPMRCTVEGSNRAHLMFGETELELGFDVEALREFATMSAAAVAQMDVLFEQEEAERKARELTVSGRERSA